MVAKRIMKKPARISKKPAGPMKLKRVIKIAKKLTPVLRKPAACHSPRTPRVKCCCSRGMRKQWRLMWLLTTASLCYRRENKVSRVLY